MYEQESKAVLHSLARLGIGSDLVWVFAVVTLVSSLAVLSLLPGLTGPPWSCSSQPRPQQHWSDSRLVEDKSPISSSRTARGESP